MKKILMVLTSHDQLGNTGKKTGFWLEEFAAPYYVFIDANADVTLASPKGGQPPLDPKSDEDDAQTDATRRFRADTEGQMALADTVPLSEIDPYDFDTVFYPGGHGRCGTWPRTTIRRRCWKLFTHPTSRLPQSAMHRACSSMSMHRMAIRWSRASK